jgi:hypothetical protein
VLTAAHCVLDAGVVTNPADIEVVLGINNLSDGPTTGSDGQRIAVVEIIPHPAYDESTSDSDLALLRLASPAVLGVKVGSVGLVGPEDGALVAPDTPATVTGWGVTSEDGGAASDALLEVEVPLVSNETCNAPSSYNGEITDNMICAGEAAGGKDSCQGDSGGPLVVSNGSGGWLQVGVVSWGNGCAQPDYYGVYTRVSSFKSWILLQLDDEPGTFEPTAFVYLPLLLRNVVESGPDDCLPVGESDNISDALSVSSGQTVCGQVSDADRDDVYKIYLTTGQQLTVSMSGSGGDADLYLYPPGSTNVNIDPWTDISVNDGNDEYIQRTIGETGFWYVDVYSFSGTTEYSVTVSATP